MKKPLLQDLILPAFWLIFFTFSSKSDPQVNELKKADNTELKKPVIETPGASNADNNINEKITFAKAIYLAGF